MMVLDTSAIMTVLLQDPPAAACQDAMLSNSNLAISAGTLTEVFIVASHRGLRDALQSFLNRLEIEVVPVTGSTAQLCADAHLQWGKGIHPAGLNFGDCFAYALAKQRNCPLLYIGDDFARTDIASAL